jgi:integrase
MRVTPGPRGGWVFTTETGAPISPRTDSSHWKQLLKDAGIHDSRLHDARHTAATILLLLGVSQPTMMSVMGWSNPAMAQRYAHVVDPIRRDVAERLGGLLWDPAEPPPGGQMRLRMRLGRETPVRARRL